MGQRLKILTYNAGLFRFRAFGRNLVEPAPHVEERFAALAPSLLASGADIIALQEVYDAAHQSELTAALSSAYPHRVAWSDRGWLRQSSGLMIFSKFPIARSRTVLFRDLPWEERLFVHKGVLFAEIEAGQFGLIAVANCHHTSGGALWDPEGHFADGVRSRQYRQLFAELESFGPDKRLAMGDFNAGPEASGGNYAELIASGYADAWARRHAGRPAATWDPANPLNSQGPHRQTSAQRLDHVLLSPALARSAAVSEAGIVLSEPSVEVPGAGRCTPSDHYGLMIGLDAP